MWTAHLILVAGCMVSCLPGVRCITAHSQHSTHVLENSLEMKKSTKCDAVRDQDIAFTVALETAKIDGPRLKMLADECNPLKDEFWDKATSLGTAFDKDSTLCNRKSTPPKLSTFCYGLFKHCDKARPLAYTLLEDIEPEQKKLWAKLGALEKEDCGSKHGSKSLNKPGITNEQEADEDAGDTEGK